MKYIGYQHMSDIKFTSEEKEAIARKIQVYFQEELEQEIGSFDAQFLLDFFSEEIGPFYYNRGLHDALALFEQNVATTGDAIYEIEKPVKFAR